MKIEKLLQQATDRPWVRESRNILGAAFDGSLRRVAPVSWQSPRNADANAELITALANGADALVALVKAARALGSVPHEYSPHDDKECPACTNAREFQEALAALPDEWRGG